MPSQSLTVQRLVTYDHASQETRRVETESNVWLVSLGSAALLIDAGFGCNDNTDRIVRTVAQKHLQIQAIYLTHGHRDHVLGAPALSARLGCSLHCHPLEKALIEQTWRRALGSPQRDETSTAPLIADLTAGVTGRLASARFRVLHTPGHSHGHIALWFADSGDVFTGDTIVPSGTVWIGPPDGHMTDYLGSLEQLLGLGASVAHTGHGHSVRDPMTLITAMRDRRLARESAIWSYLSQQEASVEDITAALYGHDLDEDLTRVASRTVLAHIERLAAQNRAVVRYDITTRQLLYRATGSR
ncbi:MAG: MBL fold metallo-hydrolase [Firmicutes bacterium]|nr:MBL fold metallo-hydrolase [Bacillota bacterium]